MDGLNDLIRTFQEQNGWTWMVVAAVLFTLETLVPGVFLVWFGLAAVVVGVVVFLAPEMSVAMQIALFAALSVVSVLVGRQFLGSYRNPASDKPMLNERGHQYVGQVFELKDAIRDGRGRITVGDSVWLVRGPELPEGTRVRVTGAEGTMLVVEKA